MQESEFHRIITSPVGPLALKMDMEAEALTHLSFWKEEYALKSMDHPLLKRAEKQLQEYFEQRRTEFDLTLRLAGSRFQQQVWKAVSQIPFGKTKSYLQVARELGDSAALRAVGSANGKNPIPIIIPCHRVIGSDGSLTGYSGGIERKRYLLILEGCFNQISLF